MLIGVCFIVIVYIIALNMVVCNSCKMYAVEYFLFDFSQVVCCKQVNINDITVLVLLKRNSCFQRKFLIYFHLKVNISPKHLFRCLRKNLVGRWKGFFNHKRNRRKFA